MGSRGASSGRAGGGGGGGGGGWANKMENMITKMVNDDPSRLFYGIHDLRIAMRKNGMSNEEFDRQIKRLRDSEVIQLHQGSVYDQTPEQRKNRFTDENGFIMSTFTLTPSWGNRKKK